MSHSERGIYTRRWTRCIALLICCVLAVGLSVTAQAKAPELPLMGSNVDSAWQPLITRLEKDGFARAELIALFSQLSHGYSTKPMGRKVRELYRNRYEREREAPSQKDGKTVEPAVYSGVVVDANLRKARKFLQDHHDSFHRMEQRYGVPREVAVGLMLVETRLGAYLGNVQAFRNLACLANTTSRTQVMGYLQGKRLTAAQKQWLSERVRKKSDWAYAELKALLAYAEQNNLDAVNMPGSVYGAVGICQFMPSNILLFGVDGNGDGKVNLFHVDDAIHSLANFLKKHGWKSGLARSGKHRVLKRYNRSNMYANTILAVAEALGG